MSKKLITSSYKDKELQARRLGMHALDIAANKRGVLVLGNYRQTITVVRSLARAGYRVILGTSGGPDFSRYSRCVAERWDHPPLIEQSSFLHALKKFINRRPDIGFIFPVGELCITALSTPEARINPGPLLAMPDRATVNTCLDKGKFYRLVASLNIPLAETLEVENSAALEQVPEKVGFPFIVKRSTSFDYLLGKKALKCEDADYFYSILPKLVPVTETLIVQRFFQGERHNCHFAAEQGRLKAYVQHKVLRSEFPDDIGYEVDGITVEPDLRLRDDVEKIAHALNYTGVGCVQFLVDPESGGYSALELNPRLDATTELPYRCGVDFPAMALECAVSAARAENVLPLKRYEPELTYPAGVRLHWLMGDLQGLRMQLANRQTGLGGALSWLYKIVRSTLLCDHELVSSLRDPVPFAVYLCEPLAGAMRRIGGLVRKLIR